MVDKGLLTVGSRPALVGCHGLRGNLPFQTTTEENKAGSGSRIAPFFKTVHGYFPSWPSVIIDDDFISEDSLIIGSANSRVLVIRGCPRPVDMHGYNEGNADLF